MVTRDSTNLCDNGIKWQGAISTKYLIENPVGTNIKKKGCQLGNNAHIIILMEEENF